MNFNHATNTLTIGSITLTFPSFKSSTIATLADMGVTTLDAVHLRTPVDSVSSSVALNTGITYYTPIQINRNCIVDTLSIKSGSGHTGTTSVRLGLWEGSSASGKPTTLLAEGVVSLAAANSLQPAALGSISLTPGIYWVGLNAISASGTLQVVGAAGGASAQNKLMRAISATASGNLIVGYQETYNAASGFTDAGTLTSSTATGYVFAKIQ